MPSLKEYQAQQEAQEAAKKAAVAEAVKKPVKKKVKKPFFRRVHDFFRHERLVGLAPLPSEYNNFMKYRFWPFVWNVYKFVLWASIFFTVLVCIGLYYRWWRVIAFIRRFWPGFDF